MSDNPILVDAEGINAYEPAEWMAGMYYFEGRWIETPEELERLVGVRLLPVEGASLALYRMMHRLENYMTYRLNRSGAA